jgi:16S rRNA (guanine527-N7)-methyltransferase
MPEQFTLSRQFDELMENVGVALDRDQLDRLAVLGRELLSGNQRVNLTAVTDPLEIERKHFLDSLVVVPLIRARIGHGSARLVDVGAGAGFPGLPLAVALPELEVTLIEATGKKVEFLAEVIEQMGITNAQAVHARAEELGHDPALRASATIAVARAVASVGVLCELTLPFLAVGGRALLWKTHAAADLEIAEAQPALAILGGNVEEVVDVSIPGTLEGRICVVIKKMTPTPERFPRRPGVPQRRPLGSKSKS